MVPLQAEGSIIGLLLPFIIVFGLFYFVLIRPQQMQQKKRKEMLESLRRGDNIITIGGIHGEITTLKDDIVTVRIADNVEVKMNKNGINHKKSGTQSAESSEN